MKHIVILISATAAFKIPENQAKDMLKSSKPLAQAQIGGQSPESNFMASSLERECVEEHCNLSEYIENKEFFKTNEMNRIDISRIDSYFNLLDQVEAYFNRYYTNCLPFAVNRNDVKLCLEAADDIITNEVFTLKLISDPRLSGEEKKPTLQLR